MKLPFHFHKETLFFFLAGSVLFFLSSRYFGGMYIRLSRFWFTFFILDIVMLLINHLTLRYSLDFNRDHMSKGDTITYTISIQSGSILPVPLLMLELAQVHREEKQEERFLRFSLKPGESWIYSRDVHASLRGIYTMGLSRLSLRSLSGLLSLDMPIWARDFYVYPRIIDIPKLLTKHPASGGRTVGLEGQGGDAHNFLGLREYRDGEGLKHMSWSRFMQTGKPYIKTYASMGGADIHIFLDRRSSGRSALCDDTVLEVFLCLLYSGLNTGQNMILHGYPGWEGKSVLTRIDFDKLYQSTLLFEFDAFDLEELKDISSLESVYTVSSMPDFSLLDENSPYSDLGHLICVSLSFTPPENDRYRSVILRRKQQGAVISDIPSDYVIKDELICQVYS
jgi:Protein of unknown function DUF58